MPGIVPRVFVSSTRADLAEYRTGLLETFPSLDVLYRGMEFFGARAERPLDVMLNELLECDLYLGIFAFRYGSVDPNTGISYTETEYRTAKQEDIPRICFIIDSNQPVPQSHRETMPERVAKLEQFKETVRNELIVETFTTVEDLATKASYAIRNWTRERASEWQQLLHVPITAYENEYIRTLYSDNTGDRLAAIGKLKRVNCRAAEEHFYGLLHKRKLPEVLIDAMLHQLILSQDERRVAQMLLNLSNDTPRLRAKIVNAIGERSTIDYRHVTAGEADYVLGLIGDPDPEIRGHAAHALGKIGSKRSDRFGQCREALMRLKADSVASVQERAAVALQRMTPPTRGRDAASAAGHG